MEGDIRSGEPANVRFRGCAPIETANHLGFRRDLDLNWENVQTKLGHEQAVHPSNTPWAPGKRLNRTPTSIGSDPDSQISVQAGNQDGLLDPGGGVAMHMATSRVCRQRKSLAAGARKPIPSPVSPLRRRDPGCRDVRTSSTWSRPTYTRDYSKSRIGLPDQVGMGTGIGDPLGDPPWARPTPEPYRPLLSPSPPRPTAGR
jgi:hypothetical protein